jgi:4-amino-4-deoxy-L-arabinose transferase-like glycosyltransferase
MNAASGAVVKALLAASALLLFLGLGANTIWDANEAFYVETPRQMVLTGDYVHPQFNGEPRMNKPVLSYWIVAGFYHLFGISVGVERLAIAIGALGIAVAAFVFGRALRSPATGALAALLLLTAPRFVMFSRRIFIDIWVTAFMTLALACFVLAETQPDRRRRWLWLMYAAIGCGVLTKGPIALLFPAATIGTWLLLQGRWRDITRLSLLPGVLIVLAIVVPWWAAIYMEQGWEPLRAFWLGENIGRFTESMQPGERDIFFYIPVVLGDLFPWSVFVVAGLLAAVRGVRSGGPERHALHEHHLASLLLLWVLWHVGVFSFSETKQDLYVFPIIPALAALAADRIVLGWESASAWIGRATIATAALMVVAAVGLFWLFGSMAVVHQIAGANLLGVILVTGAVVAIGLVVVRRATVAVLAVATTMVAANYVFALVSLPAVEAFKPVAPMVEVIRGRNRPDAPPPVVAHYRTVLPSMAYYLQRPIEDIFDMETLIKRVQQVPEMYVLINPAEYGDLQRVLAPTGIAVCIAARQTLFEAKLKNVLEGRPWPEIYLAGTGAACNPSSSSDAVAAPNLPTTTPAA